MARERITIRVDGIEYSFCQISPTKSALIFLKLVKIFGPAFGKAFLSNGVPTVEQAQKMKTGFSDMPMDKIIEVVADRMDEDEIMTMSIKLLSNTYPMGKGKGPMAILESQEKFDAHFIDTPGLFHMGKLLKEVLFLQYGDFFGGEGILSKPEEEVTVNTKSQPVP